MKMWSLVVLLLWNGIWGCQAASLTAAKLYLEEGDTANAAAKLDVALEQEPDNPEVHFLRGRVAANNGQYAAMDSALVVTAVLDPSYIDRIAALKRQYWIEEYNQGVDHLATEPPSLTAAGAAFRNAIRIDPEPIGAWRNLAYVAFHLDSTQVAVKAYEHIVGVAPADTVAMASLGALYLRQSLPDQAVEVLQRLTAVHPGHFDGQINLGVAYEELGRLAEAEEAYARAVAIDPESGMAHYNLGNLYWSQQDFRRAISAYEKAVELSPEDHNALYNLAVCYLSVDDYDAALPILVDLTERMPDNVLVWRELGRVYAINGRIDDSKRAYDQAQSLSP